MIPTTDIPVLYFTYRRDINYTGWATVELYPYETTAANVAKNAYKHLHPLLPATHP